MNHTLNILVIDDDEVDRLAVQRSLKKAGIKTQLTQASSANQALAILETESFDCIFLDYRLPDHDGITLVRTLQTFGVNTPLIVLTGQGDEQIAVAMMKAGASDYLSKSRVSPDTLSQTLRNVLRIHQAEQELQKANQELREANKRLIKINYTLEEKQREIALKNQELQQKNRLQSQFLATMSHELRTPMNAVMGFSQMLLSQYPDPLTSKQLDIVKRIFDNSSNLLTMINELLDFSKIEAGKLTIKASEFDIIKLVTITTEELRSLALDKHLNLRVEATVHNPIIVSDQNCLRRILVNLLSNAIKFTTQGEILVKLDEITPERLALIVKDTGIGIAPESLKTIFAAFRQGDQSLTRQHSGTGLGLAITDSLVKIMQGTIQVESQLGQGSIFKVEIPRQVNSLQTTSSKKID